MCIRFKQVSISTFSCLGSVVHFYIERGGKTWRGNLSERQVMPLLRPTIGGNTTWTHLPGSITYPYWATCHQKRPPSNCAKWAKKKPPQPSKRPRRPKLKPSNLAGVRTGGPFKINPGNIPLTPSATLPPSCLGAAHCPFATSRISPLTPACKEHASKSRSTACESLPIPVVACTAFCCISSSKTRCQAKPSRCILIPPIECTKGNMLAYRDTPSSPASTSGMKASP